MHLAQTSHLDLYLTRVEQVLRPLSTRDLSRLGVVATGGRPPSYQQLHHVHRRIVCHCAAHPGLTEELIRSLRHAAPFIASVRGQDLGTRETRIGDVIDLGTDVAIDRIEYPTRNFCPSPVALDTPRAPQRGVAS